MDFSRIFCSQLAIGRGGSYDRGIRIQYTAYEDPRRGNGSLATSCTLVQNLTVMPDSQIKPAIKRTFEQMLTSYRMHVLYSPHKHIYFVVYTYSCIDSASLGKLAIPTYRCGYDIPEKARIRI